MNLRVTRDSFFVVKPARLHSFINSICYYICVEYNFNISRFVTNPELILYSKLQILKYSNPQTNLCIPEPETRNNILVYQFIFDSIMG